jgi:LmbE family N-acetylglucosaminyl deacetylase
MIPRDAHVLIIAAHPDDEVLGAGGFMAHHHGCSVALVSEGTSAERVVQESGGYDTFLAAKRAATQQAAGILQAVIAREGDFIDQQLVLSRALQEWIEAVIEEARPDVVLTHALTELNRDHRVVAEAVLVACRPFCGTGQGVQQVLTFQVDPLSVPGQLVEVNQVLPLTEPELQRKLAACTVYESAGALRTWPHPRSRLAVEAQARALGSRWGVSAAEGYSLVWGRM